MRIRIEGTRAEITYSMIRLREVFTVTSVSRAYPARTNPRCYRIFIKILPRESR